MNTAFLCLGGNLGDREQILGRAIILLGARCGRINQTSRLYETAGWQTISTNSFLNQVTEISTSLTARSLLSCIRGIETELGRVRSDKRNADRLIDIDILFFNSEIVEEEDLEIPHPRLHLRKFVLVPLEEIASEFNHPRLGKTVTELLTDCEDDLSVQIFGPR